MNKVIKKFMSGVSLVIDSVNRFIGDINLVGQIGRLKKLNDALMKKVVELEDKLQKEKNDLKMAADFMGVNKYRFNVHGNTKDGFWFSLVSGNGKVVCVSEKNYKTKSMCEKGIVLLMANAFGAQYTFTQPRFRGVSNVSKGEGK